MLSMIDLYRDRPDLYDLLHDGETADLSFYAGIAGAYVPPGGSVLELGCGSGRVMAVLLERGLRVTGVDAEPAMLERARRRMQPFGARASLLQGDMAAFDAGGERFDLILIAANTFMHLPDHPAQRSCLDRLRAHLAGGGVAVLDLANPFHVLGLPQGTVTLRRRVADPETGDEVLVSGVLEVDPTVPHMVDHLFFDRCTVDGVLTRLSSRVELRLVFMSELELLLAGAGLGLTDAYGDYDLGPYQPTSERMIAMIRAYE